MNRQKTITVGIPAYNEEGNIGRLLTSVIRQKLDGYHLEKIIVVSDASTDATENVVSTFSDTRITMITNEQRLGASLSQNVIAELNSSDYLVMLDADIILTNKEVLSQLLGRFDDNSIDMVYAETGPLPPINLLQTILYFSVMMKRDLYRTLNRGNNIYLCRGQVRVFSKNLIQQMRWKPLPGEDAYAYLYCLAHGFGTAYESRLSAVYSLPTSLYDHLKQSARFFGVTRNHLNEFDPDLVSKAWHIPLLAYLAVAFKYLGIQPAYFLMYLALYILSFGYYQLNGRAMDHLWEISYSTKKLPVEN